MGQERAADRAVDNAAGDVSGSLVQAGSFQDLHIHGSGRRAVSLPYRFGVVPPLAAAFRQRTHSQVINQVLSRATAPPSDASLVMLSGLGGVGKTQLAVEFAERAWSADEVDLLAWVTASSRDTILTSYARLAYDLTGIEDTDAAEGAARLLQWLSATGCHWLMVLDDVRNPADLQGLWPPAATTGRAIVTTRRKDASLRGGKCHWVDVEVFAERDACAYLETAVGGPPRSGEECAQLARDLGCLPLALAQAAAYMIDRDLSFADYRNRLADRRRNLASLLPEPDALPDGHRDTVAATWSLSVDHADQLQPAGVARPLLELASYLDPGGIPSAVFATDAVADLLANRTGRRIDAEQVHDGLRCLARLSLLALGSDSPARAVRVHALVQRAVRDQLNPEKAAAITRAGANALLQAWPDVERDTALAQALRANAESLNAAGGEHLWTPDINGVLFRLGRSLGESGLAADAANHFLRLQHTAQDRLGTDHPETLAARNNLNLWRGRSGDSAAAATALEKLVTDYQRVLGLDHHDTLIARNNLAHARGESGDAAGAAAAFEALLTDCLRVFGPDHPDTLVARSNLARWQVESGNATDAVTAGEELVLDYRRSLGPDHPHTLIARNNLAHSRGESGDAAGAAAAFEELLTDRQRVLGPDHPDTLAARSNLASWRGECGDTAGAAALSEALVADYLRILGPDHPATLAIRNNSAHWRGKSGDAAGAAAAFEELVADYRRILGPDHPRTIAINANLIQWKRQLSNGESD
ncbi:tetratricopeptide repeat protein [Amycolatopsis sp. WGS_07]|uniref:tetratricopeptide repeat protein n=1 Tax=Amycolatopsis sp. WGS_07 TaxID=3076764 RepID=UPI003873BB9F